MVNGLGCAMASAFKNSTDAPSRTLAEKWADRLKKASVWVMRSCTGRTWAASCQTHSCLIFFANAASSLTTLACAAYNCSSRLREVVSAFAHVHRMTLHGFATCG